MAQRNFLDKVESAIPFVMPAIGGGLAVIWVNLNPMKFYNPMIWLPAGMILGWLAGRVILRLMDRVR
ncbi:hypothetical protein [Aliiroseovarius sp.]|uniref:hypothetical protein n=1 Tax=Aliiroseovarius sp. TaxID=1872442 RepID=UPI002637A245|nr:hypothetical protein [Aliiroseovarius sp.]